jgi:hypothetical protein
MRLSPILALAALSPLALAACDRGSDTTAEAPAPTELSPSTEAPPLPVDPASTDPAGSPPDSGEQGGTDNWRVVANPEDASALGRLNEAWRMARASADETGFADEVQSHGALVDPNAGLEGRLQPPPGDYRCRSVRMGVRGSVGLGYVAYPFFRCTVELTPGGDLVLTKTTGSQRTRGLLYPDTDRRLVYVGTQAWGDQEQGFPRYGQMRERDQLGVFERIGPNRWRLVIPFPKQEAQIDILELVR